MFINFEKCQFAMNSVNFLVHNIRDKGILPTVQNLQKILDFSLPKDADHLRSFLGMCNPWKPLNYFHTSSITLQNDSFLSEFINLKESESIPVEQFKHNLNKMYAIAQEMNARQDKYATYVDRKKLDDILHVNDKVYVYFPRMKRMKLVPNWYGPFRVIFADHPIYRIEIKIPNRAFTKVVTRDRIKRPKSDAIISNFNENIFMETESIENNIENVDCTEQSRAIQTRVMTIIIMIMKMQIILSITIGQGCGRDQ